eukprot:TRINITY_DN5237_c1_g2_i1.p3 TRINITY_DN5237_c1_g2~~TRINITY_DN5237_c1_g2_i1.p3  ORF type:complete len:123 (+),score=3.26 TRINITY_DN5237_c1_g2_i1:420-788(+)
MRPNTTQQSCQCEWHRTANRLRTVRVAACNHTDARPESDVLDQIHPDKRPLKLCRRRSRHSKQNWHFQTSSRSRRSYEAKARKQTANTHSTKGAAADSAPGFDDDDQRHCVAQRKPTRENTL